MQRRSVIVLAAMAAVLTGWAGLRADDGPDKVKAQKEAARAHWKRLFPGDEVVHHETPHLLLYGPASFPERQLKALGTTLESQFTLASKALQLEAKEELWEGKLTVYLFDQRANYTTFVRGVEKRRPLPDDLGSVSIGGATPHVAAGPARDKGGLTVEQQAGEQLVGALVTKRAGTDVPHSIKAGFARATAWRATPSAYAAERNRLRTQVRVRTIKEALGTGLKPEEALPWRASVVDYLAYGLKGESFVNFLEAFKPDEGATKNTPRKTAWDALKSVKLTADRIEPGWRAWVAAGR